MSRSQSPRYPHIPLKKAIDKAKLIFEGDRTNAIDRLSAANHLGYSGINGAADKMLATLAHYGLLESAGKGETKITDLGMDIFAPSNEESKKAAVYKAGKMPDAFQMIDNHFESRPSEGTLKNWLIREHFQDPAIQPLSKSYFRTLDYLIQEGALENDILSTVENTNADESSDNDVIYGGAKIGDYIQWEVNGILKLPTPARVRQITDDNEWVFVEGSNSGIPMQETILQQDIESPAACVTPMSVSAVTSIPDRPQEASFILSSGKVRDVSFEVRVTGEVNQTVIDRIIKYLELTKEDYDK